MVYSMLVALAANIPQITVKAFILHRYGHDAFLVNGSLESLRAICAFISQPLVGVLSDRHGRRLPLSCCALGLCIPHAILALGALDVIPSVFVPWAVLYVLCGTFKGSDAMVAAYIVDLVAPSQRASALGMNLAMTFGLSGAIGNVVGAHTTTTFGPATTFALPVCLALANATYVWLVLPESMPERGLLPPRDPQLTPPMLRGTSLLLKTGPPIPAPAPVPVVQEGGEPGEAPVVWCGDRCGGFGLVFAGFRLLGQDKTGILWGLCSANFLAYLIFFGFICSASRPPCAPISISLTCCEHPAPCAHLPCVTPRVSPCRHTHRLPDLSADRFACTANRLCLLHCHIFALLARH